MLEKKTQPYNIQHNDYFSQEVGIVTLQYPHEKMDIPDNGRYQLDCEIDDCIVCDKCAKICPVDCIEIEAIKSPELIGHASDGSPIRLYAAKFDIDMAKCCFCGLCTTVCPTECLTMNSEYDYSTYTMADFNFAFSNLSPDVADEKRKLYEQFMVEKQSQKAHSIQTKNDIEPIKPTTAARPLFKPTLKKTDTTSTTADKPPAARPVFKPALKMPDKPAPENNIVEEPIKANEVLPVFKPTFKKAEPKAEIENISEIKPIFEKLEIKEKNKPKSVE